MTGEWRATYRVQLTAGNTFADVAEHVPYLAELGISHLYLSPVLEAVAGSTHGYDGTDPTTVSLERGGEDGLRALAEVAHEHGLGLLVDLVPNHLAASDETPWWRDPRAGRVFDVDDETGWYRRFFDIDGLAGVRQEDPEVFDRTHAKVLELVRDGVVDGLRIDHPDGLTDPAGYLRHLAEVSGVPIWVEKILHEGEALRPWPVEGRSGTSSPPRWARCSAIPRARHRSRRCTRSSPAIGRRSPRWPPRPSEQLAGPFRRGSTGSSPWRPTSTRPRWPTRWWPCPSTAPTWSPAPGRLRPRTASS
ncbi:MAG: alpha-amylase family glycosyl hydrolase [Acidimicrobiales bacterium]